MIVKNPFRNEKIDALTTELSRDASQMERLLRKLPTTDVRVLGELHTLSMRIDRMVSEDPGRERNFMLLEQAKRKALFQRQRYIRIVLSGMLRNA